MAEETKKNIPKKEKAEKPVKVKAEKKAEKPAPKKRQCRTTEIPSALV